MMKRRSIRGSKRGCGFGCVLNAFEVEFKGAIFVKEAGVVIGFRGAKEAIGHIKCEFFSASIEDFRFDFIDQGGEGLLRGPKASVWVFAEDHGEPFLPCSGAIGDVDGLGADEVTHEFCVCVAFEADFTREPFCDDESEGEEIGVGADIIAKRLFGGRIAGCTKEPTSLGFDECDLEFICAKVGIDVGFGEAEVDDFAGLGLSGCNEDVFRFDVAVQDILGVHGVEGPEELFGDGEDTFAGSGAFAIDDMREADSRDVFHGDVSEVLELFKRVDGEDVWV